MNYSPYEQSESLLYEDLCLEKDSAFRFFYKQVYQMCIPYTYKSNITLEVAEDLLQDCLAIFLVKLRDGTYQWKVGVKISTYFYKVFQNQCLKTIKKMGINKDNTYQVTYTYTEESPIDESSEDILFLESDLETDEATDEEGYQELYDTDFDEENRNWIFKKLNRAMNLLKEDCQKVLYLFYVEGESLQTIANIFKMTLNSATQKRHKCANYLKNKFHLV